jgi:uncharacterized damage-inducible protein DinB
MAKTKSESKSEKPAKKSSKPKSEPAAEKPAATMEAPVAPAPKKGRAKPPIDFGAALVDAFATNERINQYLLENLDPSAWSAEAPVGKGRTIRGIVAHLHNVRHMWLVVADKEIAAPEKLDRASVTLSEARTALAASAEALTELLRRSVAAGGHVKDFKPDVAGFLAYVVSHEAHHRGQICMLARMLGKPLPQHVGFGMWEWRKRHAETQPQE